MAGMANHTACFWLWTYYTCCKGTAFCGISTSVLWWAMAGHALYWTVSEVCASLTSRRCATLFVSTVRLSACQGTQQISELWRQIFLLWWWATELYSTDALCGGLFWYAVLWDWCRLASLSLERCGFTWDGIDGRRGDSSDVKKRSRSEFCLVGCYCACTRPFSAGIFVSFVQTLGMGFSGRELRVSQQMSMRLKFMAKMTVALLLPI